MDKKHKLQDEELMLRNDINFVYLFNYIDSIYEGKAGMPIPYRGGMKAFLLYLGHQIIW